jgi:hypothetical protein
MTVMSIFALGVGVLVFRVTLPDHYAGSVDDVLKDRFSFEGKPFSARLRDARELWIFAPSAINLLAPQNCDTIRNTILANPDGVVRIVVLDPAAEMAVQFATRQLDDSLDHPSQLFRLSLEATIRQLQRMVALRERGNLEYRLADYNPCFSLVAIDPGTRHSVVIVESTASTTRSPTPECTSNAPEPPVSSGARTGSVNSSESGRPLMRR